MLTEAQRRFLEDSRVAHLATAGRDGAPHLVPVCFALIGASVFVPIDEKPKRPGMVLQRLRNIAVRPAACLLVDHYQEDWSGLGWVMLRGNAEILTAGRSTTPHKPGFGTAINSTERWTLPRCR